MHKVDVISSVLQFNTDGKVSNATFLLSVEAYMETQKMDDSYLHVVPALKQINVYFYIFHRNT